MLDLFAADLPYQRSRVVAPYFKYAKMVLERDLHRIVHYYHTQVTWVVNDHPLVRLAHLYNVSLRRSWPSYLETAQDKAFNVAGMLRWTTPLSFGRVLAPGPFYGRGSTEIVIGHDEAFDLAHAINNWRDLCPVRVLRHPYTDMSMARADGAYKGSRERGIAVIAVNLPMFAVQYRCWMEQEQNVNHDAGRSVGQFVSMYPLTNMLYSHLDVALFNRLVATYDGSPFASYQRSHPIFTSDHTNYVDWALLQEVSAIGRANFSFDQIVDLIPAVTAPDLRASQRLPEVVSTRQVNWALLIARLPLYRFLVRLNAFTGSERNQWYLNRIRVGLTVARNDGQLEHMLPRELFIELDDMIHRDILVHTTG